MRVGNGEDLCTTIYTPPFQLSSRQLPFELYHIPTIYIEQILSYTEDLIMGEITSNSFYCYWVSSPYSSQKVSWLLIIPL